MGRPIPSGAPEVPPVGPKLNSRLFDRRRAHRRLARGVNGITPAQHAGGPGCNPRRAHDLRKTRKLRFPAKNSRHRRAGGLVSSVAHPHARSGARVRGSGQLEQRRGGDGWAGFIVAAFVLRSVRVLCCVRRAGRGRAVASLRRGVYVRSRASAVPRKARWMSVRRWVARPERGGSGRALGALDGRLHVRQAG